MSTCLIDNVIRERDPIIMSVRITDGHLRIGSCAYVPFKDSLCLGNITSIIDMTESKVDKSICNEHHKVQITIEPIQGDAPKMYGRHFDNNDVIVTEN